MSVPALLIPNGPPKPDIPQIFEAVKPVRAHPSCCECDDRPAIHFYEPLLLSPGTLRETRAVLLSFCAALRSLTGFLLD